MRITHLFTSHLGLAVAGGLLIGILGGLIGLGGAEFRLPLLIGLFGFAALSAGSLSLAVSLPTMLVGFARYSRDDAFAILKQNKPFVFAMAGGSLFGTWMGGRLLGIVPSEVLLPLLAAVLIISAWKVWNLFLKEQ